MSDVRPKALAGYMEKRNQRFAAMSQTARRIKIEQNHTWRIRLLPVEMGPDKEPFVDIAQHWWAKQPITCPKHTAEAWGGNPDFDCPVCAVSERLRESGDEKISDMGYSARCNLRVRAWCIVFDQENARGEVEDMTMVDILNPYEFDMYKTTWESFAKFQKWATSGRRGSKEASDLGLLDLETGCDLLATQGAKGVTLDRCDPGPIFPLNDPKFDEYLKKIWSRIHKPQIVIPSEDELWKMADKIEEYAQNGGRGGRGRDDDGGRGRGRFGGGGGGGRGRDRDQDYDRGGDRGGSRRSRYEEDQDPQDAAPARGSSRRAPEPAADQEQEAPARRRAPEPQAEQEQEQAPAVPTRRRAPEPQQEADPQPEQEAPQPPTRRAAAPQTPTRRAPEPEAEQEQAPEEQAPAPAAPPTTRRGAPAAPPSARKTQQAASADNGEGDGDVAPQRPPQRRGAAPVQQQGVDEEEDNVPEEKRDPAPASREPVDNDPPPAVGASGPAPRRSVGDTSDIKARLDKLNARGR